MNHKQQKVLFIAHDASRSGAPGVLLSLLIWLKSEGSIKFDILLLKDGPLRKEFEKLATTHFTPVEYKYQVINKVRRRINPELAEDYKIDEVVRKLGREKYDLVYGNSIVSLPWLLTFQKKCGLKTICAIHELTYVIEFYFKREFVMSKLSEIDLIIAGSRAVAENLIVEFGIKAEKIKVIHAFIESKVATIKTRSALRTELGILDDELVIGGMGSVEMRKGIDLIIPLAQKLKGNHIPLKFKIVWVGGSSSDNLLNLIKQDAIKAGVEKDIIFVENTPFPNDYINLYDIFVLLSREDPFPLVLLTAAIMEKAVIAFEKSGGAPELLENGAGFLAPYLDVDSVAAIITRLYFSRSLISETGSTAKWKVEKNFSEDVIPPRVLKILQDL